jgi:hypothetical protein
VPARQVTPNAQGLPPADQHRPWAVPSLWPSARQLLGIPGGGALSLFLPPFSQVVEDKSSNKATT